MIDHQKRMAEAQERLELRRRNHMQGPGEKRIRGGRMVWPRTNGTLRFAKTINHAAEMIARKLRRQERHT